MDHQNPSAQTDHGETFTSVSTPRKLHRIFLIQFVVVLILCFVGIVFVFTSNKPKQDSLHLISPLVDLMHPSSSIVPHSLQATCPAGFILVPGSSTYHTSDFCVMKYDAKCADKSDVTKGISPQLGSTCAGSTFGTYKNSAAGCACTGTRQIVSTKSGAPLAYLPEESADQTNAKAYCTALGWHLMTNAEWMTIARNVETVNANWCDKDGSNCGFAPGTKGKILSNGHNDSNNEPQYSGSADGALVAGDDNQPCFGTTTDGSNICGGKGSQRRILDLTNGQMIWDFAGNVWSWIDAKVLLKDQPQSISDGKIESGWQWSEFSPGANASVITGNGNGPVLGYDAFRPTNPAWNSTNGVGRIYHYSTSNDKTTVYTFIRGGNWRHGYDSGAFTIHLSPMANKAGIDDVGFRCVSNPS